MFNKGEMILDRVRSITFHDPATMEMYLRLTQLEETTLSCTAESEEVTDAVGALITTLYRSQRATLSATNSLFSFDLLAAQLGEKKQIGGLTNYTFGQAADNTAVIPVWHDEQLKVDANGKITLAHKAINTIPFIYGITAGDIAVSYTPGSAVSATNFVQDDSGDVTVIEVPTGVTGTIFVEYQYNTTEAERIIKKASDYPTTSFMIVNAIFRDRCNDNLEYAGKIISSRAKMNPESIEVALTTTGKHSFEVNMQKDYCSEDDELFSVIIAE